MKVGCVLEVPGVLDDLELPLLLSVDGVLLVFRVDDDLLVVAALPVDGA